jgi:hypothetical protein
MNDSVMSDNTPAQDLLVVHKLNLSGAGDPLQAHSDYSKHHREPAIEVRLSRPETRELPAMQECLRLIANQLPEFVAAYREERRARKIAVLDAVNKVRDVLVASGLPPRAAEDVLRLLDVNVDCADDFPF